MRSPPQSRGSWAAAARTCALAAVALLACASASCSRSAQGSETPVPPEILAPATDLPLVGLCSSPLTQTADERVKPLFCHDGSINVLAWKFYAPTSDSMFRMGRDASQDFAQEAVCADLTTTHSTRAEEADAFQLATAYYAWKFLVDTNDPCI